MPIHNSNLWIDKVMFYVHHECFPPIETITVHSTLCKSILSSNLTELKPHLHQALNRANSVSSFTFLLFKFQELQRTIALYSSFLKAKFKEKEKAK